MTFEHGISASKQEEQALDQTPAHFRSLNKRGKPVRPLLLALLVTAIFWQPVFARPRSDLDMEFVEGAKKEKKLAFYTTMDLPQTIEIVRDFAQKYPFLDLELHPLEAETLVKRIQNEARSGMSAWDVLLGGGGLFQPLLEANLIISYHSPQRQAVSDGLNDSEGYWSGYYINPYVLGYNTTSVKEDEIPKKYDELLEPRWKGSRIAIDSTAHGLLRGLAIAWGEDKAVAYLKRLAGQQPVMARASITAVDSLHTGNVSMVIARAPVIQGYKKKLQSPIDWILSRRSMPSWCPLNRRIPMPRGFLLILFCPRRGRVLWPAFKRFQSAETWNHGQRLGGKDKNGLWNGPISMSIFERR
jgi:hypothetical protein